MDYWAQRQKQLNDALEASELQTRRRLYRIYRAEALKLASQIDAYYAKYGVNGVVSYRVLKQKLSPAERDLLYRDIYEFKKLHPEVDIDIALSASKIDRLEALQKSVLLRSAELGLVEEAAVKTHLEGMAARGAEAALEHVGKSIKTDHNPIIQRVVEAEWADGKNFSGRIWDNRKKLAREINTRLAQGFARGESRSKLVKEISKRFTKTSKKNIDRLVYTEGTYVMAESQATVLEENGFKYYALSCAPSGNVCPFCRDVEAQHENMPELFSNRVPGENFPPLHPWCRCTFDIVVPDRMQFIEDYGINSYNV